MENDKWLASGLALNTVSSSHTTVGYVFLKKLHVVTFPNCWKDTKALKKD